MNQRTLYSIGELARRTGLPVRTVRFYSDAGVLPPSHRSPANHRRYDQTAVARLDLIRTLRRVGVDLATVRRVLADEMTVAEAADVHADVLDLQIRHLRRHRAVLRAVARRDAGIREMELMHRIVQLSETERHRLVHDFIDNAFGDTDANPDLVALLRSTMPDLPDEPTTGQVECWIELAELTRDAGFRDAVRRMAEHQAAERADGDRTGLHHDLTDHVRAGVTAAIAAGVDPASAGARPVVAQLVRRYAETFAATDSAAYRAKVLARLEVANDPRVERYWQLIAGVNGWPAPPSLAPVFDWFIEAIRHHAEP